MDLLGGLGDADVAWLAGELLCRRGSRGVEQLAAAGDRCEHAVWQAAQRLDVAGLACVDAHGGERIVAWRDDHGDAPAWRELALHRHGLAPALAHALDDTVEWAALTGAYADAHHGDEVDVAELFVAADPATEAAVRVVRPLEERLGLTVHPTVLHPDDWWALAGGDRGDVVPHQVLAVTSRAWPEAMPARHFGAAHLAWPALERVAQRLALGWGLDELGAQPVLPPLPVVAPGWEVDPRSPVVPIAWMEAAACWQQLTDVVERARPPGCPAPEFVRQPLAALGGRSLADELAATPDPALVLPDLRAALG